MYSQHWFNSARPTYTHFCGEDTFPIDQIKVELKNCELWKKFHDLQTEMIITKSGRRMFPGFIVQISHMEPHAQYCVVLEMQLESSCRFKYSSSSGWSSAGNEETQSQHCFYIHPESPSTGEQWMSQNVSFNRLKLTNTASPPQGHITLSSMHRYQPRIIIIKSSNPAIFGWVQNKTVAFPETQFIAVTAYQNEDITKLKIDHNPFAKGFRENGRSNYKRKQKGKINNRNESDLSTKSTLAKGTSTSSKQSISLPVSYKPMYNTYQYIPNCYSSPIFQTVPGYKYVTENGLLDFFKNNEEQPRKFTDFSIKAITGIL